MLSIRNDITRITKHLHLRKWETYRVAVEMLSWARASELFPKDLRDLDHELTPSRYQAISDVLRNVSVRGASRSRYVNKDAALAAESIRAELLPHLNEVRLASNPALADSLLSLLHDMSDDAPLEMLPYGLCDFVRKMVQADDGTTVCAPFDSTAVLALHLASSGLSVAAEVHDEDLGFLLWALSTLGGWSLDVRVGNALAPSSWSRDLSHGEKLAEATQAVGVLSSHTELRDAQQSERTPIKAFLPETHQLAGLLERTTGRAVVVTPTPLLFRGTGGEREFKEKLIRRGWLESVIQLPRGHYGSRLPNVLAVLTFDKTHPRDHVLFVDGNARIAGALYNDERAQRWTEHRLRDLSDHLAADDVSMEPHRRVSNEEVATNEFNLTVERYVLRADEREAKGRLQNKEILPLEAIVDFIRPQMVRERDSTENLSGFEEFFEIGLADLRSDGSIARPTKTVRVSRDNYSRAERQRVQHGDLLLSIRGSIGKAALYDDASEEALSCRCLASQAFLILRLRPGHFIKEPEVLLRYFSSPHGQALVANLSGTVGVPMVPMGALRKLPVIVPTPSEIHEIRKGRHVAKELRHRIEVAESELAALNAELWPMS